jgi:ribosomal protein L11 methyltransferase
VIANILAAVILKLFDDGLADLVEPGGRLILSGILAEQIDEITAKLDSASLKIEENMMIEDWVALCTQKIRF